MRFLLGHELSWQKEIGQRSDGSHLVCASINKLPVTGTSGQRRPPGLHYHYKDKDLFHERLSEVSTDTHFPGPLLSPATAPSYSPERPNQKKSQPEPGGGGPSLEGRGGWICMIYGVQSNFQDSPLHRETLSLKTKPNQTQTTTTKKQSQHESVAQGAHRGVCSKSYLKYTPEWTHIFLIDSCSTRLNMM